MNFRGTQLVKITLVKLSCGCAYTRLMTYSRVVLPSRVVEIGRKEEVDAHILVQNA